MTLKEEIEDKLKKAYSPVHLEVANESSQHNVPKGSESHFKLTIVAEFFRDHPLLERHRAINALLADELKTRIHALAMSVLTPEEWQARGGTVSASPPCLKKEK